MKTLLLAFYFLSANQADYDGKMLTFSGNFQVDHPMGRLKSEKALLENPQLRGTRKKGSTLILDEGVSISTNGRIPFTISAKRAHCSLPPYTFFSLFQNQQLEFYEEVCIDTVSEIRAVGGSAIYKMGNLTLYPAIPATHCQLFRGADRIDATTIRFNLFQETLFCEQAHGILEQDPPLSFSAKQLLWEKKEGKLHLETDVCLEQYSLFSLFADTALLTCQNELDPVLFELNGNIRLISPNFREKMSFASADWLSYFPKEKRIVLSAISPKRVLFWQEGLSLSAPQVVIEFKTQETIEGIGDVHFALDLDEQYTLEKLFSNYL